MAYLNRLWELPAHWEILLAKGNSDPHCHQLQPVQTAHERGKCN